MTRAVMCDGCGEFNTHPDRVYRLVEAWKHSGEELHFCTLKCLKNWLEKCGEEPNEKSEPE